MATKIAKEHRPKRLGVVLLLLPELVDRNGQVCDDAREDHKRDSVADPLLGDLPHPAT